MMGFSIVIIGIKLKYGRSNTDESTLVNVLDKIHKVELANVKLEELEK